MISPCRSTLVLLVVLASITANAAVVTVGVGDQNREALSVKNGRLVGSLAKTYQCALDNSNLNYQLRVLPQARVLHQLERGQLDLGLPLVKLSHRDNFAIFTHPMRDVEFHLYTRNNIEVSDDLSGFTFVVLRASASIDLVVDRNARFKEVTSWTQALSLARLGRFDGAVIPRVVINNLAADNFAGLTKLEFGSIPLSMYVSKNIDDSEELALLMNHAIMACLE